jgi:hypothetical protein
MRQKIKEWDVYTTIKITGSSEKTCNNIGMAYPIIKIGP